MSLDHVDAGLRLRFGRKGLLEFWWKLRRRVMTGVGCGEGRVPGKKQQEDGQGEVAYTRISRMLLELILNVTLCSLGDIAKDPVL